MSSFADSSRDPAVFIIGVPRSGTTLLRVLLNAHSRLAVGPECPWIAGSYGEGLTSVKALYRSFANNSRGPVANLEGVDATLIRRELRNVIDNLLQRFAEARGKQRWVEKTPNHLGDLPFLAELFPEAHFVHIVRDGRDVACSTYGERTEWGRFITMTTDEENPVNTRLNALQRWCNWINRFETHQTRYALRTHTIRYEDLVGSPKSTLSSILDFLDERWEDQLLDYERFDFIAPDWESGSRDVLEKSTISTDSLGRWRDEFTATEKRIAASFADSLLTEHDYAPTLSS